MITYSYNEISSLIVKASVGAGFPYGHATELAKAMLQYDAINDNTVFWEDLLQALNSGHHNITKPSYINDSLHYERLNSVCDSISLCDYLASHKNIGFITINEHTCFYILLVFLHQLCLYHSCKFIIKNDEHIYADIIKQDITLHQKPSCATKIVIFIERHPIKTDNTQAGHSLSIPAISNKKRLIIADEVIQHLQDFAYKTYVPASKTSRLQGAGAIIDDNE